MNSTRFIYNAYAVGVGANFGGPDGLNHFWASRGLPVIGGIDPNRGEAGPSGHPVLNFAWAETQLSGIESTPGIHDTMVRVTVQDLDILRGGITADLVSVTTMWRCDLNTSDRHRTVAVTGAGGTQNPFVNLRINNVAVNVDIDAPGALPAVAPGATATLADFAAQDYPQFRTQLPGRRPGHHHTKPPRAAGSGAPFHTAFTHLAKLPNAQIDAGIALPPTEFGVYNGSLPAGVARIYLCDWLAEPERQGLTIMRIKLSAPTGEIVICDPVNGSDFP